MITWTLQDAKARFSELVNRVLSDGTQIVSRHGKDVVAVVPYEEYRTLSQPTTSLKDFLLSGPRVDMIIERDSSLGREVDL